MQGLGISAPGAPSVHKGGIARDFRQKHPRSTGRPVVRRSRHRSASGPPFAHHLRLQKAARRLLRRNPGLQGRSNLGDCDRQRASEKQAGGPSSVKAFDGGFPALKPLTSCNRDAPLPAHSRRAPG